MAERITIEKKVVDPVKSSAATARRNRLIVEELTRSNKLHPAFSFQSTSTERKAVEISLSSPVLSDNEREYLRFVTSHLLKRLLDESSRSSPPIKYLAREVLVTAVLQPVVNLISSDNINSWIILGLEAASSTSSSAAAAAATPSSNAPSESKTSGAQAAESSQGDTATPETSELQELTRRASQHFDVLHAASIGVPPPRFRPTTDRSWRHLAGVYDQEMAEILLAEETHGTFLLRQLKEYHYHDIDPSKNDDDSAFALSYVAASDMTGDSCRGSM
jgi:hypothetical protein